VKRKREYISGFDSYLETGGENDVARPWYADSVTFIRDVIASCTPSRYSLLQSDMSSLCVVHYKLNYKPEGQGD